MKRDRPPYPLTIVELEEQYISYVPWNTNDLEKAIWATWDLVEYIAEEYSDGMELIDDDPLPDEYDLESHMNEWSIYNWTLDRTVSGGYSSYKAACRAAWAHSQGLV